MSGLQQQQSAYRYMSTAVLYRYMASAVSNNRCATHERSSGAFCPGLPVSPPSVSRLSASTSGPFLMNGQRHLRQRRRRPINRGMVHRFAKSLHHHHDVLNVRHPSERRRCRHQGVTVAHHVRRRRSRLFVPAPGCSASRNRSFCLDAQRAEAE